MKKVIMIAVAIVLSLSIQSCSEQNKELYSKTDKFVSELEKIEHYAILGVEKNRVYASEMTYRIIPIGRLINVAIEKNPTPEKYQDLLGDLKSHYEGVKGVNDVYLCEAGSIMIDCRNL